jgi:hypothetical protein
MKKVLGIGLILSSLFLLGCTSQTQDDIDLVDLDQIAQCLSDNGVKVYVTATCSYCMEQKKLFGDSWKYINAIDCMQNPMSCGKIQWTPTWEFADGSLLAGMQKISTLVAKAGCE